MSIQLRLRPGFLLLLNLALLARMETSAGTFKHITVDGSFADWTGVPVAVTDDEGDTAAASLGGWDLREVYVANDDQYLYLRVVIYASSTNANYDQFHHRFYIDSDNDPATGHSVYGLGSEMLIEDGGGYSERFGTFNDGVMTGLDFDNAPTGILPSFQYEARFSRAVRDTHPADVPSGSGNPERDLPLFTQDAISIAVDVADSNWAYVDTSVAFPYEMAAKPPTFAGTQTLVNLTTANWRANDAGVDLGGTWLPIDYDDAQAGWKQGTGLFGFSAPAGIFPAPVNTTLASSQSTYYFRTRFDWNNDSSGVGLLVSNYLSAGAVFYLNGVEVHRTRMPDGPVTFTTPATGAPAELGAAELFDLPTSVLVVGDNALAVEVHPVAGASSLVFGLSLTASDNFPPRIQDLTQPADRTITEGQATTFSPGPLAGTQPFTFQWSKDGASITGATNLTLTLDPVTPGDAGSYSVEISNPKGLMVSSRAAVLTTTPVQVAIADATLPADQTVAEGTDATFTVSATGSLLTYQWYRDNQPIEGATGSTLTLTNVTFSENTKQFSVVVSNRLNAVTSRRATLTVSRDPVPPAITGVIGAGRTVIVTFSEPLDEPSAEVIANYTLSSGVSVQTAQLDPLDPTRVTLGTAPLTLGTVYTLSVAGVRDRFNNPATASRQFRPTILIDGNFDDWAGITPAVTEPKDTEQGFEFKDIYAYNDNDYLYIRFSFHTEVGQLPVNYYYHIFSDTDNNPATGMSIAGVGSEMMIENGDGYQQKNGGFNEGVVRDLDFALAPEARASEFEVRISRKTLYNSDGLPVYSGPVVALTFQLISTSWSAVDTAPQGGLVYTFVNSPPIVVEPVPLAVKRVGASLELTWSGGGVLETRASLSAGTWASVPQSASGVLITPSAASAFYRLRQ